jgi:hypothetical protein
MANDSFQWWESARSEFVSWQFGTGATTVTISTSSEAISLTAEWNAADVDNSISCTNFTMEVIN